MRTLLYIPLLFLGMCSHTEVSKKKIKLKTNETNLQVGDIIFQSSMSGQSYAIQLATGSKFSHVGMIIEDKGKLKVIEAVQPVKITPLNTWISHGDHNQYWVKRLHHSDSLLADSALNALDSISRSYLGKNYDLYFGWSDERIYCSELVWKAYKQALGIEIGKLQTLSSFDLSHPVVQQKLLERYGNNIPMEEKVISPGAMFDSENLQSIVQD